MKSLNTIFTLLLWFTLSQVVSNCSSSSGGGSSNSSSPALPYCSTITSYSNPITITGTARYEFRTNGNGAIGTPNAIRHAEIRVTDGSGSIIQCGETDSLGNFSLSLPNDDSTATITIASRADNNFLKAYVMNNPTANAFYGITSSVTLDGSRNIGTMTASATGAVIPGGAFHILDKIMDANEFLRTETANCSATFSDCPEVTVAPKVDIYWAKGVNPGSYFGLPPLSFYLPEANQLFILGGTGGDVDNTDTDHFDTSVILHEYAHALENLLSVADSPGGIHNGDNILDPRLAWSEGWSNFFQAAVTGNPVYRDTFGTPLGTNGVYINESLESGTTDTPTETEEGNFREFSVSRALLDIVDANSMTAEDDLDADFAEIWTLFAGDSDGFANTNYKYRSLGLFYVLQDALTGKTDWSTIQNAEQQLAARTNYANTLVNGSSCPTPILAEDVPNASPLNNPGRQPEDGSFANSNQFKSNDFYQYDHSGGNLNVSMTYTTTGAGGQAADLDLYIWTDDYAYGNTASDSLVGYSESTISSTANSGSEAVSIQALPAGTYMINIKYDTTNGIKSTANYSLTVNSQSKCPL